MARAAMDAVLPASVALLALGAAAPPCSRAWAPEVCRYPMPMLWMMSVGKRPCRTVREHALL